jgi:hypothetical protein
MPFIKLFTLIWFSVEYFCNFTLQDDEYVIYNNNQQVTQYLVEFSVEGDCKKSLHIDIFSGKEVETEEIDLLEELGEK